MCLVLCALNAKAITMRLLFLLLLPFLSQANDGIYKYKGVRTLENGTDNFKVCQCASERQAGVITVKASVLRIDEREYVLKPTKHNDIFKVKGGAVKFVYDNHALSAVQLYQYHQAFKFIIVREVPAVAGQ